MDIIEKIISNVEKTAKTVMQKSTDVVEITKLKMAISSDETEVEALIFGIGRLVYEAYKSGEGKAELIEEKCVQIDELKAQIDEKRSLYAKLRNLKRCADCEYENEAEAVFCCKCGSRLPEAEVCSEDDMPPGTEEKDEVVIDADMDKEE